MRNTGFGVVFLFLFLFIRDSACLILFRLFVSYLLNYRFPQRIISLFEVNVENNRVTWKKSGSMLPYWETLKSLQGGHGWRYLGFNFLFARTKEIEFSLVQWEHCWDEGITTMAACYNRMNWRVQLFRNTVDVRRYNHYFHFAHKQMRQWQRNVEKTCLWDLYIDFVSEKNSCK